MTLGPLTFRFPMPPNLANARLHWRAKDRKRKAYHATCDTMQSMGMLPRPPRAPLPRARIASTMRLWQPMDDDNAMARHKWALDWLKTRGYIVDDRRTCLEWAGLPRQEIDRKAGGWLVLTLTPVTP